MADTDAARRALLTYLWQGHALPLPPMFDSWLPESKDHLPLTWWKTHPVYLAAIIALVGVGSMVLTAVLGYSMAWYVIFNYEGAFQHLRLWTLLTYVLFNPPSFWTLIGCVLLWNFGEAVERHLGRRAFVRMLLVLLLASPALISLLGLLGVRGLVCAGIMQLEFAVFIAFATLYPRTKLSLFIISIDAWVLAAAFVAISALGSLGARDWSSLLLLAANVGSAYLFIRFETGALKLPSLPRRAPQSPRPAQKTAKAAPKSSSGSSTPTVDDILDKISHHGMQSLSAEERRILDKASEEMKRRAD